MRDQPRTSSSCALPRSARHRTTAPRRLRCAAAHPRGEDVARALHFGSLVSTTHWPRAARRLVGGGGGVECQVGGCAGQDETALPLKAKLLCVSVLLGLRQAVVVVLGHETPGVDCDEPAGRDRLAREEAGFVQAGMELVAMYGPRHAFRRPRAARAPQARVARARAARARRRARVARARAQRRAWARARVSSSSSLLSSIGASADIFHACSHPRSPPPSQGAHVRDATTTTTRGTWRGGADTPLFL